jgi:hypothetical protein
MGNSIRYIVGDTTLRLFRSLEDVASEIRFSYRGAKDYAITVYSVPDSVGYFCFDADANMYFDANGEFAYETGCSISKHIEYIIYGNI